MTNVRRNILERQRKERLNRNRIRFRDRIRVYGQHIRQPTIKSQEHLRVCGNGEFEIFPLLQMRSQDKNFKTKL